MRHHFTICLEYNILFVNPWTKKGRKKKSQVIAALQQLANLSELGKDNVDKRETKIVEINTGGSISGIVCSKMPTAP